MAKTAPSRADILKLLATEKRAMHAREIASRLRVDEGSYPALLRQLDDLAFEGLAAARGGHRFKLSKQSEAPRTDGRAGLEREGVLSVHPRGFGFVASVGAEQDDVFVPLE